MALVILNITDESKQKPGDPDHYQVGINRDVPMAYFTHQRKAGAAACLRAAADAIEQAKLLEVVEFTKQLRDGMEKDQAT